MSLDPRMLETLTPRAAEKPHRYEVRWLDKAAGSEGSAATIDRHAALQAYVAKRKELNDFSDDPNEYKVRFFCDGVEYLCDQSSTHPNPRRDSGKSCRQITGAVRPYPWERHIP